MTTTKIGQRVWYYPVRGEIGTRRAATVDSEPWALGHGTMVVNLLGDDGKRIRSAAVADMDPREDAP